MILRLFFPFSNVCLLRDDPTPSRGSQLMRASNLTLAALAFIHDLRTGQLPPDEMRGTPLDMSQYAWFFGTARIPTGTSQGCKISEAPGSRHVVVLRRGYAYWFDALDHQHRPLWTEASLVRTLQAICDDADACPPATAQGAAVGILTSNKRGRWHAQRQNLIADPHNAACLAVIDSALFVLCLDDDPIRPGANASSSDSESNPRRLAQAMLSGTYEVLTSDPEFEHDDLGSTPGIQVGSCTNRWWDKLQIVVTSTGGAGINFEHTALDGHTVLRFVSDVYTELVLRFARSIHARTKSLFNAPLSPYARGASHRRSSAKAVPASPPLENSGEVYSTTPRALEWRWTRPLASAVAHAEARLSDLVCANECEVLEYTGYGKTFITAHGFSPDAWVQMALQAAYCSLYGRVVMTYEPAMTKHFRQGRTEAIRTVSPESVDFCHAYVRYLPEQSRKSTASNAASNPPGSTNAQAPGQRQADLSGRLDHGAGGETSSAHELVLALRQACSRHTHSSRLAAQGLGCDRHLYALHELWRRGLGHDGELQEGRLGDHLDTKSDSSDPGQEQGPGESGSVSGSSRLSAGSISQPKCSTPTLFADPGWTKLNTAVLSTSNCGNPALRLFGFGPTSAHGFGVGYIIKDRAIALCASSRHRQTKRFLAHVRTAFARMHAAVATVHAAANTRRVRTYIDASGHECDVRTGLPIRSNVPFVPPGGIEQTPNPGRTTESRISGSQDWGHAACPLSLTSHNRSHDKSLKDTGEHVGSTGYGFFDAGAPLPHRQDRVSPSTSSKESEPSVVGVAPGSPPGHISAAMDTGHSQSPSQLMPLGRRLLFDDTSFFP